MMPKGAGLNETSKGFSLTHSYSGRVKLKGVGEARVLAGSWIPTEGYLAGDVVFQLFQVGAAMGEILYLFQTNAQEERQGMLRLGREEFLKGQSCWISLWSRGKSPCNFYMHYFWSCSALLHWHLGVYQILWCGGWGFFFFFGTLDLFLKKGYSQLLWTKYQFKRQAPVP